VQSAPEYSEESWKDRDWESRLHQHFGSKPYWEEAGPSSGVGSTTRGTDQTAGF
jgi:hypothetical protein